MSFVEKALEFATRAHAGQVDKGGKPYIGHPIRVAARVEGDVARAAAYLHDVIEDCGVTWEQLEMEGIPAEVIEAVIALSRREGETYKNFIERIAGNPVAVEVKLADLADNSDPGRLPPDPEMRRKWEEMVRKRYVPARDRLLRAQEAHRNRRRQ